MRGLHRGDPVTQGFVDGVLQGPAAIGDRHNFGSQQLHPCNVERLAMRVFLAHVDPALQAHECGSGGRSNAVLAGSGLGNHPCLAHPHCQKRLTQNIVDLVRPGVVEILTLEVDARTTTQLTESTCTRQRIGPPRVVAFEVGQLDTE